MTFKTLKRSHLKRNIVIVVAIVFILSAIILTFTRAKYKVTDSMPLLNGTINYTLADLNVVAMYVDGEQVDKLPDGKHTLTSESYCTNEDDVRDESVTLSYDSATKGLSVSPMTRKGTKCYLYFEEKVSAGETILASDNAPTGQTTDWTGQTTYYYTGNPNNWVQFAGFWWRIIRINGDGTIRMIYSGSDATGPATSGNDTQIGISAFNNLAGKTHVGLVYDDSNDDPNQHGYGTNSIVMNILNNWYSNTLASLEEQYIDARIGFCSDRNLADNNYWNAVTIHYAAFDRMNGPASLQCNSEDVLSKYNGKLQYSIGLLTMDEALFTGITYDESNKNSYLFTGESFWTMSPYYYDYGYTSVFFVSTIGTLPGGDIRSEYGVRPVINLRADLELTGSGTTSDPFKVVGTS